jgi:hypothetical protein
LKYFHYRKTGIFFPKILIVPQLTAMNIIKRLWCETWCDDGSLKTAKTIDLCNNPRTKEPKLERAKRILPEWEGLDNEVQEVRRRAMDGEAGSGKEGSGKTGSHDEL